MSVVAVHVLTVKACSVQHACNSTEASAPWCFIVSALRKSTKGADASVQ